MEGALRVRMGDPLFPGLLGDWTLETPTHLLLSVYAAARPTPPHHAHPPLLQACLKSMQPPHSLRGLAIPAPPA